MNAIKLKPCPFCGNEEPQFRFYPKFAIRDSWKKANDAIICDKCVGFVKKSVKYDRYVCGNCGNVLNISVMKMYPFEDEDNKWRKVSLLHCPVCGVSVI